MPTEQESLYSGMENRVSDFVDTLETVGLGILGYESGVAAGTRIGIAIGGASAGPGGAIIGGVIGGTIGVMIDKELDVYQGRSQIQRSDRNYGLEIDYSGLDRSDGMTYYSVNNFEVGYRSSASGCVTSYTGTTVSDYMVGCDNSFNTIFGRSGNDKIYGLDNDDKLYGDSGNDKLYGGDDRDRVYGGDGEDDVLGGNGSDSIFGGNGDDRVIGSGGYDTIFGGDGNDVFVFSSNGVARVYDFHLGTGDDADFIEAFSAVVDWGVIVTRSAGRYLHELSFIEDRAGNRIDIDETEGSVDNGLKSLTRDLGDRAFARSEIETLIESYMT